MKNKLAFCCAIIFSGFSHAESTVYRFVIDHRIMFETLDAEEGKRASGATSVGSPWLNGMWKTLASNEFEAAQVERQLQSGPQFNKLIPIYRCLVRGTVHHFPSPRSDCEGHVNEGAYGWIAQYPGQGLIPIARYYNPQDVTHAALTACGYAKQWKGPIYNQYNPFQFESIIGYIRNDSSNC